MHLKHGGFLLVEHITLLMQMIFTQCKVPITFCISDLTPIPKKGEVEPQCSSFRLINVATSLCKLFELLFRDDLEKTSYASPYQFGFKRKTGCGDALTVVANTLIDTESPGECLASHDVKRAFDSSIHPAMLLKAAKRVLSPAVVFTLWDMYSRLKLPPDKNMPPVARTKLILVLKGMHQGAVSSPGLFNNNVIDAQDLCS
ncbi:uncharacterized protein LOC136030774 [Artemia franciscana]|uniref:uncharacterized protein LOC136030774 n=1 Tax=Artemia franciscana TaxID=6661 RepID=UPI0032DA2A7F